MRKFLMTTPADHIPQTAYNSTTATISGTTVSGDVIYLGLHSVLVARLYPLRLQ